jgi:hypothetical protein
MQQIKLKKINDYYYSMYYSMNDKLAYLIKFIA